MTEGELDGTGRKADEGARPEDVVRRCRHGHVLTYSNNVCGVCRQNAGRQSHKNRKGLKDGAGI